MKVLLQRLLKILAYMAAGIVILLAVAVGLFRLFLPRLPEYQEEIKAWASSAVGMEVSFSGMDARWGLSGPELDFYNTKLNQYGRDVGAIAAEEVRISVGLVNLLVNRTLVVDRIVIRDTTIDVDGSRGAGHGRNVDTDLPPGKGEGTRSDIDVRIDPQLDIDTGGQLSGALKGIGPKGLVDVRSRIPGPPKDPTIRIKPRK